MTTRRTAMRALFIALLMLPGVASATGIADIIASPDTYVGKSVTVVGTVENALPIGPESMFDLRDGRVKLTVMSHASPPAAGTRLSVTGTIREAHVGDTGENRDFPHVLVESSRSPAP